MTTSPPAPFLDNTAPIPIDRPFTRREASAEGVSNRMLAGWIQDGLVLNPIHGVLHAAQLPDGLALRVACLSLVVPEDAVVTDRTAGWLHGAPMVLAPNDHLRVPTVDMFRPGPGYRLRGRGVRSGERTLHSGEVVELDGVRATSKVRTTCDLGMLLPRVHAFAGMCSMMKVADFDRSVLADQADRRFKGYRWVRQLRDLAPRVDDRFQSPGECALALRWGDHGNLPPYEPQYEVAGPAGSYFLDLACVGLPYGAEYDGSRWHGLERAGADEERRTWMSEHGERWIIDVFGAADVYGPSQRAGDRLMAGIARARREFGARAWSGQDRFA
jgi:hypothetical protein